MKVNRIVSVLTFAVFVLLIVFLVCGCTTEKTVSKDLVRIAQFNIWEICWLKKVRIMVGNPARQKLFYMDTIEEIRFIKGLDQWKKKL